MITVQLERGIEEAFVRLRAYAYARDRGLTDVARDVVARRLRFTPDPPADRAGGRVEPVTRTGEAQMSTTERKAGRSRPGCRPSAALAGVT